MFSWLEKDDLVEKKTTTIPRRIWQLSLYWYWGMKASASKNITVLVSFGYGGMQELSYAEKAGVLCLGQRITKNRSEQYHPAWVAHGNSAFPSFPNLFLARALEFVPSPFVEVLANFSSLLLRLRIVIPSGISSTLYHQSILVWNLPSPLNQNLIDQQLSRGGWITPTTFLNARRSQGSTKARNSESHLIPWPC
jgi:hypothetical protein